MTDIAHTMGSDLVLASSGDLAIVQGAAATTQRVQRRLLTNPGDYIWQLAYGGGLAGLVGAIGGSAGIQARIRSQMLLEASVARTPLPAVSIASSANGDLSATITFADAATGVLQQPSIGFGGS